MNVRRVSVLPGFILALAVLIAAVPALGAVHGDSFGYWVIDSTEQGGPSYNWIDISGTGTGITLADDNFGGPYPVGFTFPFYGTGNDSFYLGSNGFISFGAGSSTFTNQCSLPSATIPNNLIALMWDDLDPGDNFDQVYYESFPLCPAISPEPCLVVQYQNYHHWPGVLGGGTIAGTFQAVLFASGDILIQFQDAGAEEGSGSTTGIEGPGGSVGLTYACNTALSLSDSLAVLFTTSPDGRWKYGEASPFGFYRFDCAWFDDGTGASAYNQKLYCPGGRNGSATELPDIWRFDPLTGTWSDTGVDMPEDVSNYHAVVLADENYAVDGLAVYVVGGYNADGGVFSDLVQRYYPRTGTVGTVATDPWPGSVAGVTTMPGICLANSDQSKIYCAAGHQTQTAPYSSAASYEYDPAQAAGSRWTLLPTLMSEAKGFLQGVVVGRYLYAVGGDVYDGVGFTPTAAVERLNLDNPAAGWQTMAPMPSPVGQGRAFAHQGRIYVAGGGDWPDETDEGMVYEISSDAWDLGFPDLIQARRNQAGEYIPLVTANPFDGLPGLWVFGGRTGSDAPPYAPTEYYPLNQGEWRAGPVAPFEFTRFDCSWFDDETGPSAYNRKLYCLGGREGATEPPDIWKFDPLTGTWTDTGLDIPGDVSNYSTVLLRDENFATDGLAIYLVGGYDADGDTGGPGPVNIVQRYYPRTGVRAILGTDHWPGTIGGAASIPGACIGVPDQTQIYCFGGFNSGSAPYNSAETYRYDPSLPAGSRWTHLAGAPLGEARGYIQAAGDGNFIYAMGGDTYPALVLTPTDRVERLDLGNVAAGWQPVAPLPVPCGEGRGFGFDGKLWVVGGGIWPDETAEAMVYDVASDTWDISFPDLIQARRNQAGELIPLVTDNPLDGLPGLWVFGGTTAGSDLPPYARTEFIPLNRAPVLAAVGNQTVDENTLLSFSLSAGDPDGDRLTFAAAPLPAGASLSWDGNFVWTSSYDQQGDHVVTFTVTDEGYPRRSDTETVTITVNNVNRPPTDLTLAPGSVTENQPVGTVAGGFSTNDPDIGDTFTYSLVAGSGDGDNASFSISGSQLLTAAVFDYETKNSYSIRVRTTDDGGLTYEEELVVSVINSLVDGPTDIALAPSSVPENRSLGTVVGTLSSTDEEVGDTFPYSLVAGSGSDDNASFSISGSSLRTAAIFDYETRNSYSVRVRSTDQHGYWYEKAFTVSITNLNETPSNITLTPASVAENEPSGTAVGTLSTTDPDAGNTFTYTLTPGTGSTDNASFTMDGATLRTAAVFDFDVKSSYAIRIRTTDQGALWYEKAFTVTVTEVNLAPTDLSLAPASVAENQPSGTTVGAFSTTDPNAADLFTYTLVAGAGDTDNASFTVSGNKLQNAAAFNFEAQSTYGVRVRTTDPYGLWYEEAFTVTVTDVNEAPTDIALAPSTVAENQPSGTTVGTLSSTDPDAGATFTYTLVSGTGSTDNASFTISGNQLRTAASFDYETKSSYSVRVRSTDNGGLTYEEALTVTVSDVVGEPPTDLSLTPAAIAENQPSGTTVGTLSSSDPDPGATFTYTLVPGTGSTDNASFTISGSSLRTAGIFNFEAKTSYAIRVRSTDNGGLTYEEALTVTVTNVNEAPTDLSLTPGSVAENQPLNVVVGTLASTDPDAGATFTYTLVSGTGSDDNALFAIVGSSLRTAFTFDFETETSFSIRVRSTDNGGLTYEEALTVTVTNVNEVPKSVSLTPSSLAENRPIGTVVGTLATSDPDVADTFTYTLVSGTGDDDNASFSILGNQLRVAAVLNYETKSAYAVRVRSTDAGGLFCEQALTVTLTNVNEVPTDLSLSPSTVAENQPAVTVVGTFATTDPDAGDTFTYTLVAGTGSTDNASFTILGNQLRTAAVFDFESKSAYSIRVQVTDAGGLTYDEALVVAVGNVNENPTDLVLDVASVAENQPAGTTVGTLTGIDPDAGDTFTYALVAGSGDTDNASFSISGSTLRTAASFNFESKSSCSILVRVTDAGGLSYQEALTVAVTNVNEAPTDLTLTPGSVAENQPAGTSAGTLAGTDPDAGSSFTYSLVAGTGDTDNASFTVSGSSLRTAAPFNFESKGTYAIRVRVTDGGGLAYEKQLTVTVTNVNEAPTDLTLTPGSVAENQPAGTSAGSFAATDPDAGETFTYSLVAGTGDTDNASFTVSGTTLRTAAAFDFEVKSLYRIRVRVTDAGGLPFDRQFEVAVTGANEAPTDIQLLPGSVAENLAAGTSAGNFTATDPDAGETFTYSLVAGGGSTDNASFTMVGNQLRTAAAFDFEAKNAYAIRVRATDLGGLFFEEEMTVYVTNVNETPTGLTLDDAAVPENEAVGTLVGSFASTDPDAGESFTYSLVAGTGGDDNAAFSILGSGLRTALIFDFEGRSSYSIRVRTTDAGGLWREQEFTVTVTNANDRPTGLELAPTSVAENQPAGTVVGSFSSSDPDAGEAFSYSLVSGAGSTDNAAFRIAGANLETDEVFDFEAKASYSIRVRTTDLGGLSHEAIFSILVTDVNEPPVLTGIGPRSVAEGNLLSITLTATDPDLDLLSFGATGLPDGASFTAATGTFTWTPAYTDAGGPYLVEFSVTDGEFTDSETVSITVTDHDATLFTDDFSDGTPTGDPHWQVVSGRWRTVLPRSGNRYYASSNATKQAVSLVRDFSFTDGRIGAMFKLGTAKRKPSTLATYPRMVGLVFDRVDATHYRAVKVGQDARGKWKLSIVQVGNYDGSTAGTKGSALLGTFNVKLWHTLLVDVHASGLVEVYLDGKRTKTATFGECGTGTVGFSSWYTAGMLDDVLIQDNTVLAPASE
jgi:hypothetical protein